MATPNTALPMTPVRVKGFKPSAAPSASSPGAAVSSSVSEPPVGGEAGPLGLGEGTEGIEIQNEFDRTIIKIRTYEHPRPNQMEQGQSPNR